MEANELRIGNYAKDRIHREVTVSEIRPEHLVFYLSNGNKIKHNIKTFEPIPLTEDWLLSFGWVFNNNINCFEMQRNTDARMFLTHKDVNNSFDMFNHVLQSLTSKNIKHVHQLQNLYFALTGKELIKL